MQSDECKRKTAKPAESTTSLWQTLKQIVEEYNLAIKDAVKVWFQSSKKLLNMLCLMSKLVFYVSFSVNVKRLNIKLRFRCHE